MDARATEVVDVDAVYREHLDGVLRLLRRGFQYRSASGPRHTRITSPFELEDICQETFKEFIGQVEKGNFDASRPAGPYLNRIAINVALQRYGKQARETPVEVVEHVVEEEGRVEFADPVVTEVQRMAAEFRGSLNDVDRGVLERCLIDGESQARAGEALGMSRDQVYRALQRVKRTAHTFFRDRGWFDEP